MFQTVPNSQEIWNCTGKQPVFWFFVTGDFLFQVPFFAQTIELFDYSTQAPILVPLEYTKGIGTDGREYTNIRYQFDVLPDCFYVRFTSAYISQAYSQAFKKLQPWECQGIMNVESAYQCQDQFGNFYGELYVTDTNLDPTAPPIIYKNTLGIAGGIQFESASIKNTFEGDERYLEQSTQSITKEFISKQIAPDWAVYEMLSAFGGNDVTVDGEQYEVTDLRVNADDCQTRFSASLEDTKTLYHNCKDCKTELTCDNLIGGIVPLVKGDYRSNTNLFLVQAFQFPEYLVATAITTPELFQNDTSIGTPVNLPGVTGVSFTPGELIDQSPLTFKFSLEWQDCKFCFEYIIDVPPQVDNDPVFGELIEKRVCTDDLLCDISDAILWVDATDPLNNGNPQPDGALPLWMDKSLQGNGLASLGPQGMFLETLGGRQYVKFEDNGVAAKGFATTVFDLPFEPTDEFEIFMAMEFPSVQGGGVAYVFSANVAQIGYDFLEHSTLGNNTRFQSGPLLGQASNTVFPAEWKVRGFRAGVPPAGNGTINGFAIRVNGVDYVPQPTALAPPVPITLYFGGRYDASDFREFNVGEIMIFRTMRTPEQRACIESYLANKWNIIF